MGTHAPERQRSNIHALPYKRTRNAKDAGCVLGSYLRIIGEHGNAVGRGKPVEKIGKGRQGGGGQSERLFSSIGTHEANVRLCRRA